MKKEEKLKIEHEKMQLKVNDTNWLLENAPIINWKEIAKNYYMDDEALRACGKYVDWARLCQHKQLNEDIIKEFKKKMGVHNIFRHQKNITLNLLEDIATIIKDYHWFLLENYILPINFIKKYYSKLNLDKLSVKHLNKNEMDEFNALVIMKKLQGKVK